MSNAEIIGRHIEELEDRIRLLSGDLDSMIADRDSWKQNCAILENENVRIRRVISFILALVFKIFTPIIGCCLIRLREQCLQTMLTNAVKRLKGGNLLGEFGIACG